MNTEMDCRKAAEYVYRMTAANLAKDIAGARKHAQTSLVFLRRVSRTVHAQCMGICSTIRAIERQKKKLSQDGIAVPLADARLQKLWEERDIAEKDLASVGEVMHCALELWQRFGATFEDLCCLCNRDPAQVKKQLGEDRLDESLSKLAMVYNLDYKNPRDHGWLEDSVDAPITHALKAYLLDTMLHTEAGRRASHQAMEAVFPELMDHVVYPVTDADGVQRLFDKDGNEIGILPGEEA